MAHCSKLLAIILSRKFVYPCGKQLKGMSRLKSVLPYCYQTKLDFSGFVHNNVNLLTWSCEGKRRVYCRCQNKECGQLMVKKNKTLSFLMGFREVFLWVKWGTGRLQVGDQLVHNIWLVAGEDTSYQGGGTGVNIIRLQSVWGLCAHGHHAVSLFHWWGL